MLGSGIGTTVTPKSFLPINEFVPVSLRAVSVLTRSIETFVAPNVNGTLSVVSMDAMFKDSDPVQLVWKIGRPPPSLVSP